MKSTVLRIVALLLCRGSWSAEADLTLQQLIHKGWTVADGALGDIGAIAQTTDGTLNPDSDVETGLNGAG
jgi:hypothetical protein